MQSDGSTDYIIGMDFSNSGTCSEVVKAKMKVKAKAEACNQVGKGSWWGGWKVCLIEAKKDDWIYFHLTPKVPQHVEQASYGDACPAARLLCTHGS